MTGSITRRSAVVGVVASATTLAFGKVDMAFSKAKPKVHNVSIKGFEFDPKIIRVNDGDTIKWTNHDLAPHTATATELSWDTMELVQNQSGEIVVTPDMELTYFCVFHPHMKGVIEII